MTAAPPRVLHCVGSIAESTGGPARTVTNLCSAVAATDRFRVGLIAGRDRSTEQAWLTPSAPEVLVDWVDARHLFGRLRVYPRFRATLSERIGQGAALIHDHGIWGHTNWAAASAARVAGLPYVLSSRGMLEPWALRYKAAKKRVAWVAYQRRIVAGAALLVATANDERDSIKALMPHLPVAVVPNGVRWPAEAPRPTRNADSRRRLLFISRVHPKKNILGLLEAWKSVVDSGSARNWVLSIAGPDELGHVLEVRRRVAQLALGHVVEIIGPVGEADKAALWADTDLAVLPSFSENFGVVVAEALAAGVPVIATTGTPWSGLRDRGCGWWVAPNPASLAQALTEATRLPDRDRDAMGRRGRRYAQEAFSWQGIGATTADVYGWVLDKSRPMPGCVYA
jgi:glycosyltransferase involved in cell wall biosynthesis